MITREASFRGVPFLVAVGCEVGDCTHGEDVKLVYWTSSSVDPPRSIVLLCAHHRAAAQVLAYLWDRRPA